MNYKPCPSCGEKLNPDARSCVCGWQPSGRSTSAVPPKDTQCTFQYAGTRCRHPVGFFDAGASSGWCIFHRSTEDHALRRDIVNDSQNCTQAQYLDMARRKTYGQGDAFEVAKIRKTLKENAPHGMQVSEKDFQF